MELTPMRYKDYVWPHNPETYTITYVRDVAAQKIPFGRYALQDLGLSYRVMRGEGAFAGAGAYDEFRKLASVFYDGGAGVLVHPVWQTTRAYFTDLTLLQEPLPDYVRYRFAFREESPVQVSALIETAAQTAGKAAQSAAAGTSGGTYTVVRGDTLWGIARRCGVTLAALLAANPQIRNPNYITVGQVVKLP